MSSQGVCPAEPRNLPYPAKAGLVWPRGAKERGFISTMSGWLLMAGILAAIVLVWLVIARGRRVHRPEPARRPLSRRPVARERALPAQDTEIAAEISPEGRPPRADAASQTLWGRVAVPAWEHPVPWAYDKTSLTALVRDPYWLFSYWELTGEAHRRAEDAVGAEAWRRARAILRVYDAARGSYYDVAIDEPARNWYLNVGQPDRSWYLEIGRRTASGRFVMLARSNVVYTPRDGPSEVTDPAWPPLGRSAQRPEVYPTGAGLDLPSSPGSPGALRQSGPGRAKPERSGEIHPTAEGGSCL
jgi:hypothetical protein